MRVSKTSKTLDQKGKSWWDLSFEWLKKENRYWGYRVVDYSRPIYCFGFWFFGVVLMVLVKSSTEK